ncbi:uncharacterized protein LOC106771855 isoform X3 [Vigna radiata var. radiata]|uniref:Uncharacterized protein LOC106771855 isoform X3 n=1 Tax=Vigna radiata var. radiata TaxID=3916 RepID=A0A1S3V5B4_VIGRR|nr:uncharacterized protein LOC106771855 isoform X3 [Vigna radiata var. radiata]
MHARTSRTTTPDEHLLLRHHYAHDCDGYLPRRIYSLLFVNPRATILSVFALFTGRETCPVVSEVYVRVFAASSSAFSALHTKLCISPPKSMAYYYSRLDFFCHLCGTTLIVPSSEYAQCSLCKTLQDIQDIRDKEISYTITAEKRAWNGNNRGTEGAIVEGQQEM